MEISLDELVKQGSLAEDVYLDILLSLWRLIKEGIYEYLDPTHILVDEDFNIKIHSGNKKKNVYFMAPEQIFDGNEENEMTAWFSFGMLYYYMKHSENWYLDNKIPIYKVREIQPCIIDTDEEEYTEINKLLSLTPKARKEGAMSFIQKINTYEKGKILVKYVFEDCEVAEEEIVIESNEKNYAVNKKIKGMDGNIYQVMQGADISCRIIEQIIKIPVKLIIKNKGFQRTLFAQFPNAYEKCKLFDLTGLADSAKIPIILGSIRKIDFFVELQDYQNRQSITRNRIYSLNLPIQKLKQEAMLVVYCEDFSSKIKMGLFDKNQTTQIFPKIITFDVGEIWEN